MLYLDDSYSIKSNMQKSTAWQMHRVGVQSCVFIVCLCSPIY